MSNFDDRLERDLEHIADRATPSPTPAWEAIQSRIAAQADQPEMEITMLQPDPRNDRRLDTKVLAMAAAALLFVAGLSFVLFSGADSNSLNVTDTDSEPVPTSDPAPATTTPATTIVSSDDGAEFVDSVAGQDEAAAITVAEEFIAARNTYDGDAVRALVADDAAIAKIYEWIDSPDDYGLLTDYERAHGMRFIASSCTAGSPGRVRCSYKLESDVTVALGVGPYDASFLLEIADGVIHQVNHNRSAACSPCEVGVYNTDVLNIGFGQWVGENHPDDSDLMYDPEGGNNVDPPFITAESVALWEQYVPEFIASLAPDDS